MSIHLEVEEAWVHSLTLVFIKSKSIAGHDATGLESQCMAGTGWGQTEAEGSEV